MADPNIEMLRLAVADLGDLIDELVFVGGCTTGLFITDEASAEVRATKDVRAFSSAAITELLTQRGFIDSIPGHVNPDQSRINIVIDRLRQISKI